MSADPAATRNDRQELYRQALDYFLSPVLEHLRDPAVTEVMINGPSEVFVERQGRLSRAEARFPSARSLHAAIRNILQYAGRRLADETQSYDARLPDGSRVHVLLPPSARNGPCVTIRKFSRRVLDLDRLVAIGALTEEAREFLAIAVLLRKNLVVAGGTGSGKTTLLNCLSGTVPADERIVVIEDSSELRLPLPHVVYLEVRPPDRNGRGAMSVRDLFRASLRMRPDRIVIGEVRGGEALDLVQAMTSGHSGSLTTLHANSPIDALRRLETMAMMSTIELPLLALRAQVAAAVEVVVQVSRLPDGSRRITGISEVLGLEAGGGYATCDVFRLSHGRSPPPVGPTLEWTGHRPSFTGEVALHGLSDRVHITRPIFAPPEMQERPLVPGAPR